MLALPTLCDNHCLSFGGVLLGKALKTIFRENYPYFSSFHTETRRVQHGSPLLPNHYLVFNADGETRTRKA
jgi:hypothetical protein